MKDTPEILYDEFSFQPYKMVENERVYIFPIDLCKDLYETLDNEH